MRRNTTDREKRLAEKRKKRVSVTDGREILSVKNKEDGFTYRWVNDIDGRVKGMEARGWEHVDHDVEVGETRADSGSNVGSTVSKGVGRGTTAFLMRIENELYDEDQLAKQKMLDEKERAMKKQLNNGEDGQYGKVKIG